MDVPEGYIKLRYVKSPSPKDIRLFLAYFPTCLQDEPPVKLIESNNEKTLLVTLEYGELSGQREKPEDLCYQQKIVIFDKENQEAVVYDVDFFKMKYQRPNEHLLRLETEKEHGREAKKIMKASLTETFGSRTSRKLLKSKRSNNSDAIMGFTSEAIKNAESFIEEIEEIEEEELSSYFPPHDMNAVTVKDAFPLDGIITREDQEVLLNVSREFIKSNQENITEWETNKMYGSYVCQKLKRIPDDEMARQHFSSLLMYFHYLVSLYACKAHELRKKDFLPRGIPAKIKSKLLDNFTLPLVGQKNGRTMPSRMKDRLLFQILVLALHIDDFDVHILDLNDDIRGKDLVKYFRMIGCKIDKIAGDTLTKNNARAILKVPLVFPEFQQRGRKKKSTLY